MLWCHQRHSLPLRRTLQARQRVGRAGDEEPAERHLNQPTPPTWRELERSVERHAAGLRAERCDANDFVIGDAKRQANVERQVLRADCLAHPKRHLDPVTYAGTEDEPITAAQLPSWRVDQCGSRPTRQLARRREDLPDALGGRIDDISWANL